MQTGKKKIPFLFRLYNESWLLDLLKRIQGDETSFFVPYDLEISIQELSYLVKKAEQWRGIGGERRKVSRVVEISFFILQGFTCPPPTNGIKLQDSCFTLNNVIPTRRQKVGNSVSG